MRVFLAVALAIASVSAQRDPTHVCLPTVWSAYTYDFEYSEPGYIAMDFRKGALVVVEGNGIQFNYNLTTGTEYLEDATGKCVTGPAPAHIQRLITECLPSDAKLFTNTTTMVGYGANSVEIETWEISLDQGLTARLAVTKQNPSIPVIREVTGLGLLDVLFFSNAKLEIDDPDLLEVPAVCQSGSVVG